MSEQSPNRDEIAARLEHLVGQPFWAAHRSLDLLTLQFGEPVKRRRRHGEEVEVGRYALHIQCAWRLLADHQIIVGSRDRFTPRGNPDEVPDDFDCNQPQATLWDERMAELLGRHAAKPLVVTAVSTGDCGAFGLAFTEAHALEVFPDDSTGEQWRSIDNLPGRDPEHYVFPRE
jgi:hypothetical protein